MEFNHQTRWASIIKTNWMSIIMQNGQQSSHKVDANHHTNYHFSYYSKWANIHHTEWISIFTPNGRQSSYQEKQVSVITPSVYMSVITQNGCQLSNQVFTCLLSHKVDVNHHTKQMSIIKPSQMCVSYQTKWMPVITPSDCQSSH